MIRVMIVEDEPPINRLLQTLIESYGEPYQIVSSVYNGQEALDVVGELRPDVVFTDIKMPCVDGLELTKRLRVLYPDTLVVVISGYGDYETMRAMLQQNVFDYLLKPIQAKALGDLLRRISKTCIERRHQQMTQFFLQTIKSDTLDHTWPVSQYDCLVAGIGCVGSFPASLMHSYALENDAWPKESRVQQFDGFDAWQIAGTTNAEQVFILGFSHSQKFRIEQACIQFFQSLTPKYPLTVLFGKPVTSVADASISTNLLRNILPLHIRIGESQIFTFCDIQTDPCIPDFSLSREQQASIQFCIKQGNFSSFTDVVKELFNSFRQYRPSQYCVMRVLKWIVQCLESHILDKTCYDRYYADLLVDEAILNAFDYSSLQRSYLCICEDIFKIISQSKKKSTGIRDLVAEIADYLEQNFDQPITSTSLEEHFLFSSSYITQLFKKQKGISPNKYLLQIRAKKACELITLDPDITAKVLSETLGFSDPLYLYKFFKNETGYTLSEYKAKVHCKDSTQDHDHSQKKCE